MADIGQQIDFAKRHFEQLMSPENLKQRAKERLNARLWIQRYTDQGDLAKARIGEAGALERQRIAMKPGLMEQERENAKLERENQFGDLVRLNTQANALAQMTAAHKYLKDSGVSGDRLKGLENLIGQIENTNVARPTETRLKGWTGVGSSYDGNIFNLYPEGTTNNIPQIKPGRMIPNEYPGYALPRTTIPLESPGYEPGFNPEDLGPLFSGNNPVGAGIKRGIKRGLHGLATPRYYSSY